MKSQAMPMICRLLVVSMTFLSVHSAHAGMIGVDQAMAGSGGQAEREAVLRLMSRSEVSSQFQSLGLDVQTARERVAAMTDEEVRNLAGKLETLPAGASSDWGWGLAAVIVVAAVIYYFYGWKK